jgi:hypothetical protein
LSGSVTELEDNEIDKEEQANKVWRWAKTGNEESYNKAWLAIRELCAREETGWSHEESCRMCVAVRIKPANDISGAAITETHHGERSCNISLRGELKDENFGPFPFDVCFDSTQNGVPELGEQEAVFRQIGMDMLSNAWSGYNVSLIAYGSAGSGDASSAHSAPAHSMSKHSYQQLTPPAHTTSSHTAPLLLQASPIPSSVRRDRMRRWGSSHGLSNICSTR